VGDAKRVGPGFAFELPTLKHQAAMQPLLGTQIESDLIDAELLHATGHAPTANVTADTLLQVSPLRGLDPAKR